MGYNLSRNAKSPRRQSRDEGPNGDEVRAWSAIDVLPEILDDVLDLVFAFTVDGRYLFINKAAGEFLGADPIDVIGCHWRELDYPPEVMLPFTNRVSAVAGSGEPEFYRARSSPQRGSKVLDLSLTPIFSDEGLVLAVLVIGHDISEFV